MMQLTILYNERNKPKRLDLSAPLNEYYTVNIMLVNAYPRKWSITKYTYLLLQR